ncbi:hypothetical protein [Streptacidiphilus monticola]|uniref:Secreted protein n=1 Tax=Streptacidiphilus monticola TaxID=2161674 RepID=A0ABW1G5R7_9ACTN
MATAIAVIVVLVLLLGAALAVVAARRDGGSGRLRRRFGPEYDLAVPAHDGDEAAAAEELTHRLDRFGDLRPRPLEPAAASALRADWAETQRRFVDSPPEAVAAATDLVAWAARLRGYPDAEDGTEAHLAALSVHHPDRTQAYRESLALADGTGPAADTDALRAQLLRLRELFTDLLADADRPTASKRSPRSLDRLRPGRRHPASA